MKIIPIPNLMALSGIVEIFQIKTMILKRHNPTFLHGGHRKFRALTVAITSKSFKGGHQTANQEHPNNFSGLFDSKHLPLSQDPEKEGQLTSQL